MLTCLISSPLPKKNYEKINHGHRVNGHDNNEIRERRYEWINKHILVTKLLDAVLLLRLRVIELWP